MTDLTAEHLREVVKYDPETGRFFWLDRDPSQFRTTQGYGAWRSRCLGKQAGAITGHGYRRLCIDCLSYLEHRLAWLYVHGTWPREHIDHINGDGLDNRLVNLREVTNTENHRNVRLVKTNKSGVSGVQLSRYGTWIAVIWDKAKIIRLGSFKTRQEAVEARRAAEKRLGYHPNHGKKRPAYVGRPAA